RHGLSHHLDGARLWNAAVALGVSPAAAAAPFDSVSVCLSKGLGTPVGSVLVGPADLIDEAHKWRKMLGGGMRQAGIVAAAGLYALEHHIERLADDHANAARLAQGLAAIDGVKIDSCATNMVFIRLDDEAGGNSPDLSKALADRGVLTRWDGPQSRLVTHLDVSAEDVEIAVDAFTELLA
ncbi:MAG: low-specificity L-threonine aldolase, partial [Acidimicrobiaceae bacterium]|nr:low-specificity L-threonine aldolase [Acidimicrobiaceae bacterium]